MSIPTSSSNSTLNNIVNQVLALLASGSDTLANAIAFALHSLLTIHLDIAAQIRREIDQNRSDRGIADLRIVRRCR
ncbi:cytochrome P450 [Mycobacterium lepromatosis]|uniref:cytochrome P450 n=1 Tax=Mycobacterium lepromatosis TaxID=480418 RepID=UPI001ED98C29|nr:cytochrome P450 [Mycobacterium lepromatosis]